MGDVHRLEHLLVNVCEVAFHLVVLKAAEDGIEFLLRDIPNTKTVLLDICGLLAISRHRCRDLAISLPRRHHLYLAITFSGRYIIQGLLARFRFLLIVIACSSLIHRSWACIFLLLSLLLFSPVVLAFCGLFFILLAKVIFQGVTVTNLKLWLSISVSYEAIVVYSQNFSGGLIAHINDFYITYSEKGREPEILFLSCTCKEHIFAMFCI